MRTILISMVLLFGFNTHAQKNIFAISPLPKDIEVVNGMVVGIGHYSSGDNIKRINGVNLEIPLITPMVAMYRDPNDYKKKQNLTLISNGLSIGGGFGGDVIHNGVSVSLMNVTMEHNGLSVNALYNSAQNLNGLHVSIIGNYAEKSNGINIGIYNKQEYMNGVQIGFANVSTRIRGLQIGVFNRTKDVKGLQIGLINMNSRRILPIINF